MTATTRRADYFVHGRGRGHASRAAAVLGALCAHGYEVTLHTGGDALDVLQTADVALRARSPLRRGPTSPLWLLKRSLRDLSRLRTHPPDLVVSDGDQAAVLSARALDVPTVAIGHDLIFDPRVQLPPLPRSALYAQRLNALPMRAARRSVAVHFLPAASNDSRLLVARPDCSLEVPSRGDAGGGPVLCYFRDRNGLDLARNIAAAGRDALVFGDVARREPRLTVQPFSREAFARALSTCCAVVGSSGSNLLAECVFLGKPVLATYRRGDAEQALNAHLIDGAQVGVGCELSLASERLRGFLARVDSQDFARIDLAQQLPTLSEVMARTLASAGLSCAS